MKRLNVIIGSESEIKTEAVIEAFRRFGIDIEVTACEAESGVDAQPVGREMIREGAMNRASAAQVRFPDAICIGIENGIFRGDGKVYDLACIRVLTPSKEVIAYSDWVEFPMKYVIEALMTGPGMTVGSVISRHVACDPSDPHSHLTGGKMSRKTQLADAITEAIAELPEIDALAQQWPIRFGDVHRTLPLKTLPNGIRVALFNILGDHELTEVAGKELAKRVNVNVDVLVMPEGKATALLHVMGRETGLPTVVFRKEQKPYMQAPVHSFTYRSVTTDREQTLYVDADDAAKLAGKRVAFVDDVISSGGTVMASDGLVTKVGGKTCQRLAVFTEGDSRQDVTALDHLPLL